MSPVILAVAAPLEPEALQSHRARLVEAGYSVTLRPLDDLGDDPARPVVALLPSADAVDRALAAGAAAAIVLTDEPDDLLEELELLHL